MTQKLLLALSIILIVSGIVLHFVHQQQRLPQGVIATVNGRPIFLQDVAVDEQAVTALLRNTLGRDPSEEELKNGLRNVQARRLHLRLSQQVHAEAIDEYGITVSDKEARDTLHETMPNLAEDPDAVLHQEIKLGKTLAAALRKAVLNPDQEKEVFDEYMKDIWDYRVWQAYIKHYQDAPEKIDEIENNLPKSVEEIVQRHARTLKPMMIQKKLMEKVAEGQVEVSDEEAASFYAAMVEQAAGAGREVADFESMKGIIRSQIAANKFQRVHQRWLNERLRKLDIQVVDSRFAGLFSAMAAAAEIRE